MKSFIVRTLSFIAITLAFVIVFIYTINAVISHGKFYSLKKNSKYIVLGHSHAECSFNDSLIDGLSNIANSGESYFYTYLKTKKIIQGNPGLTTVFIEFSNNQISGEMDSWIWGNQYVLENYTKYSAFQDIEDLKTIFAHNFLTAIKAQSISLKNNLTFLLGGKSNLPRNAQWGGYNYLIRDKADSLLKAMGADSIYPINFHISEQNLRYLEKTIQICQLNNFKVFLVRSPMHHLSARLNNESIFKDILKKRFPDIEFLDFKDFPVLTSERGDLEHLNFRGAKKFSTYFNYLIKNGLLATKQKQKFIEKEFYKFDL